MSGMIVAVLVAAANVTVCGAGTYYVSTAGSDTNSGAQGSPWRTIGKASSVMVAGDTVSVAAGTYSESITTTRNGASGSRITFRANGVVGTGSWTILHDYITVDGFSLAGAGIVISSRDGVNGSHCEILNNQINGGDISMTYKSNPTGCLIRGNHLYGAVSPGGDWPQIQIWGSNSIVEFNDIGPNADIDAFRFWGTGHVIRNNYVHDTTYSPDSLAHSDGFQTFGDNGDACNNIVIENNRFINSEGQMFNVTQDSVAGIHDLIIRNNVFAHYAQNGNLGVPNVSFLNNTFFDVGVFNCPPASSAWNSSNAVFRNNIMIAINSYDPRDYSTFWVTGGYVWTFQTNFFSQLSGAAVLNFDGQAGGINGGAIRFDNVAADDFHLQSNSPAINAAATLTGFAADADGITRPQGVRWDMGAYEYGLLDGMAVSWLVRNFGGTNAQNGHAEEDWDGDGMKNSSEYIAGTDPTNSASLLKLLQPARSGTNLLIQWSSETGRWYRLYAATNLNTGFDGVVKSNIAATPVFNTCTVGIGQVDCRYYRVSVEQ